ncbi:branched-chain amino acid transport system II carrier protein [Corynebacterium guangdongense]|uniref:LIVCS family branched-chain amino acid:cation transporter n=1 Tax=Corynebacterium guangdongense TaxID=1783348 RepID=A0ABU1ZYH6_9CORY|nr:branched-chain amino acid transport system II carrier protein [Corynebacterium guangdongense]MDR7329993.1 LIVCS family branched-chain amino acid:cation transporter [Corynebacterium guangdongense]WJZ18551.1 Branched-chain amino acid transport system 2 carrier protein [Corynebacterium guangdongense]
MSSSPAYTQPKSHISILVATTLMLFSMFFGAGNLIFPPMLGVQAGTSFWPAILGFLGAGVLLPVMAIIAIALSGNNVRDLASRAGGVFGLVFPILAYLSIGAFYALPRTGAVSFETAITPLTGADGLLASGVFNFIFFGVALLLSWNPSTVVATLGRWLTPALVVLLAVLIGAALFGYDTQDTAPTGGYESNPMATGLVEGYLTMDAIAALAFGIVVIATFRYNGVSEGKPLVRYTILAGVGAGLLLAVIYVGLGVIGTRTADGASYDNGATILTDAAGDLLGGQIGLVIFALIVLLACLTTAVGLITATSEFFTTLAPGVSYKTWAVIFAVTSFGMATMGLNTVLSIAAPVIGFIYPPAIALTIITLIVPIFGRARYMRWTYILGVWTAVVWSLLATLHSLGWGAAAIEPLISWAPMQDASLGWALPTVVATIIGVVIDLATPARTYPRATGIAAEEAPAATEPARA